MLISGSIRPLRRSRCHLHLVLLILITGPIANLVAQTRGVLDEVMRLVERHEFVKARLLLYGLPRDDARALNRAMKDMERKESKDLHDLLLPAHSEYMAAQNSGDSDERSATVHYRKSISNLMTAVDRLGPRPVFYYDLALDYYQLYRLREEKNDGDLEGSNELENAKRFLELADSFAPSDKSVYDFEILRTLILSASSLPVKYETHEHEFYERLNALVLEPYPFSTEEDTAHYQAICKLLRDRYPVGDVSLDTPPAVIFDLLKCSERCGAVRDAHVLLGKYEQNVPSAYLDEELGEDATFVRTFSDTLMRLPSDLQACVQTKVSKIMISRELRDYKTLECEYRRDIATANRCSDELTTEACGNALASDPTCNDTMPGIRPRYSEVLVDLGSGKATTDLTDVNAEMRWALARWLKKSGKLNEAQPELQNASDIVSGEAKRKRQIQLEIDSVDTDREEYRQLVQSARQQQQRIINHWNETLPQFRLGDLALLADTLAQARKIFPYGLDVNEMTAWVQFQMGNHRLLVESWDVAGAHNEYITIAATVLVKPKKRSSLTFCKDPSMPCKVALQIRPGVLGWWETDADLSPSFSSITPPNQLGIAEISSVRVTKEGDIVLRLQTNGELAFRIETLFNQIYRDESYWFTLFRSDPLGIKPMPLSLRRANANKFLIAFLRYGKVNPSLLKLSREGLSLWEWMMVVSYSGIAVENIFYATEQAGSIPMKAIQALNTVKGAYAAVDSWRYAMFMQKADDVWIRTRFRVVPLHQPSFRTRW